MAIKIELIKAEHGDCIYLETFSEGGKSTILIDAGTRNTYKSRLRNKLKSIDRIDAVVLSHIDDDHIGGFLAYLEDSLRPALDIGCVYINTPSLAKIGKPKGLVSITQGIELEKKLIELGLNYKGMTEEDGCIQLTKEASIDILSPTDKSLKKLLKMWEGRGDEQQSDLKVSRRPLPSLESIEDLASKKDCYHSLEQDFVNASSIAFTLLTNGKVFGFFGDAHPSILSESLKKRGISESNRAHFDYIKLSHHGSKYSLSKELIGLLSCNKFIISTNGGSGRNMHPSRECLAKIITAELRSRKEILEFITNYTVDEIESRSGVLLYDNEKIEYNVTIYSESEIIIK